MKRSSFGDRSKTKAKPPKTASTKASDRREQARKAAVRALAKAKRVADRAGIKLSEWEDEFLGSVSERVKTFGRAFADPEKGDPSAPLSMMQAVKLKEIIAKAKGEKKQPPHRSRSGGRKKTSSA